MIRATIAKTGTVLGLIALAGAQCLAATAFVDTIGTSANRDKYFQVGRELTRTVQVGYDSHPQSGDFTGVRPVKGSVSQLGTTGVPCAEIWSVDETGSLTSTTGQYGSWVIQPFTATESGYVELISFIAQFRKSAGYAQGSGRTMYVGIVDAPTSGTTLSGWTPQASVDLTSATLGKVMTTPVSHLRLVAGKAYWVVFAPLGVQGTWNANGLDYANLNWAWRGTLPDGGKLSDALFNSTNGSGSFIAMEGHALAVKVLGYAQPAQSKSISDAKNLPIGTPVVFDDVQISGTGGAVGPDFFYVESSDRVSGIRVQGPTTLPLGEHVRVTGSVTLVGTEKAIAVDDVSSTGSNSLVRPLGMRGSVVGTSNLDTVGMLVRVAGAVTPATGKDFVVSDASVDGGITCRASAGITIPSSRFAGVTGVVSLDSVTGKPVVLVRSQSDIVPF